MEVVRVEETRDNGKGDRYLLEVVVDDNRLKIIRRLSVYLYKPHDTNTLCYPKDFQWGKNVMVHLILTGMGKFFSLGSLIQTLSKITSLWKIICS